MANTMDIIFIDYIYTLKIYVFLLGLSKKPNMGVTVRTVTPKINCFQ